MINDKAFKTKIIYNKFIITDKLIYRNIYKL